MNCRIQARPLPESEKDNITFCKIGSAHEPNTGEYDEQETIFGQGRSAERQESNARIIGILTVLVLGTLALVALWYGGETLLAGGMSWPLG